ncbi:hypothetical protein [Roseivivax isoporae]|uniref:hypothetical protein n=1 Tax=Roseivivax isoporae TaxID=591206 RepID=UPI001B7FEF60|nr:hypothetical protein [Roseivivax isoporae]
MQLFFLTRSHATATRLFLATALAISVAGCMTDNGSSSESLERARLQNLTAETALNAQIMSDRAREQRCDRDPSRREC